MTDFLIPLAAAYFLALPIAFDREVRSRTAGLRTFPLVALGSCAFLLIGQEVLDSDPSQVSRLLAGLITGIGFIGGGAILKENGEVMGTATAASIWITAGIGAAAAFGLYDIALALSAATFVTLLALSRAKKKMPNGPDADEE